MGIGPSEPKKIITKQIYHDQNGDVIRQKKTVTYPQYPNQSQYQREFRNCYGSHNVMRQMQGSRQFIDNQQHQNFGNKNSSYMSNPNQRVHTYKQKPNLIYNPQNHQNPNQNDSFGKVHELMKKPNAAQIPPNSVKQPNKQFYHVQQQIQNDAQSRRIQEQNKKKQEETKKLLLQQKHLKEKENELMRVVQDYQKKIQEAQALGKKFKDPTKFRQYKAQATDIYVAKIKELKFVELEQNQFHVSVKFIIGRISSGKSTLINAFFGTKLEVGMGQTTLKAGLVYKSDDVQIYDTPGQCDQFNTNNLQIVKYIASCNEVYILFPDSLKTIQQMVKVVAAIKPHKTYLLRTQCDNVKPTSNRTVREQIEEDKRILKTWGLDLPIFATSAKRSDDFEDNGKVKHLMTTNPTKRMEIEH